MSVCVTSTVSLGTEVSWSGPESRVSTAECRRQERVVYDEVQRQGFVGHVQHHLGPL